MKGLNRIGNLLVPNANYCQFEDWVMPVLDEMLEEQKKTVSNFTWLVKGGIREEGRAVQE
jgi:deoxyhypusine synthase